MQEQSYARRLFGGEGLQAATELHDELKDDERGFKMLYVMLRAALESKGAYDRYKIPFDIFVATMGCFSRFVREYKVYSGVYGFDRWWWAHRQLSLRLFRIGALEYELTETNGEFEIAIHIPSDTDFSPLEIDGSLTRARAFFDRCDIYKKAKYSCCSWLLSPALRRVLPCESRILQFQNRFKVEKLNDQDESYKLWVYKSSSLSPSEFPENTSLQRNLKRYVLEGGKVGEGYGVLRQ